MIGPDFPGDFGGIVTRIDAGVLSPDNRLETVDQITGPTIVDVVTRRANAGGGFTDLSERVVALPGTEDDRVHVAAVFEDERGVAVGEPHTNVTGPEVGLSPHNRSVHLPHAFAVATRGAEVDAARDAVESALLARGQV